MTGEVFEIRLYRDRAEVHYGEQAPLAWTPKWAQVLPIPGGGFPAAVAAARTLVPEGGTGTVKRFEYMGVREARWRKRFDVVEAGGGDELVNEYRVQLRPKGWKPEAKREA